MAGWRTWVLVVVVGTLAAGRAQADPVQWRWYVWTPPVAGDAISNMVAAAPMAQTASAPAAVVEPIAPVPPQTVWQTGGTAPALAPPAPGGVTAPVADAFINFATGPYASAGSLISGNAQPWYDSPAITHVFGGVPNAQQQADFTNTVLQRVEHTYQISGVPVQLTTDPSVPAAHSISVVSAAVYPSNPQVAGITTEGSNGFSFVDKFASASSVDQLEWVLAHNIAHELMHAFGGDHHDTTGTYLDSGVAPWSLMTDPNARFSQASVQELLSLNFKANSGSASADGQIVNGPLATQTPEPASIALWGVCGAVMSFGSLRRLRKAA